MIKNFIVGLKQPIGQRAIRNQTKLSTKEFKPNSQNFIVNLKWQGRPVERNKNRKMKGKSDLGSPETIGGGDGVPGTWDEERECHAACVEVAQYLQHDVRTKHLQRVPSERNINNFFFPLLPSLPMPLHFHFQFHPSGIVVEVGVVLLQLSHWEEGECKRKRSSSSSSSRE